MKNIAIKGQVSGSAMLSRRLRVVPLMISALLLTTPIVGAQNSPDKPPKSGSLPRKLMETRLPPGLLRPSAALAPPVPFELSKVTVEEWNKRGQEAFKAHKVLEAITDFKQALLMKPEDNTALYGLGLAYDANKQYRESIQAFQTLCRLNSSSPQLYAMVASVQAESNRPEEALKSLQRALELSPDQTAYHLQYAGLLMQQKEYRQAQKAYIQALGSAPDDTRTHNGLGDAYEQNGQHTEALAEYDAVLNVDSNDLGAKLGRATALASLGRSKESDLQLTKAALDLTTMEAQLRSRIALALDSPQIQAQLRFQSAQIPAQQAIIHTTHAQILNTLLKRDEAINEYLEALKIAPDNATTWGNLGWTQYEAGQYDVAIRSSRKALEKDTTLAYVRLNLGLIYAVQNHWPESQKEYQEALSYASPVDLKAGFSDVRDALAKQPGSQALQQALNYLSNAVIKSQSVSRNAFHATVANPCC